MVSGLKVNFSQKLSYWGKCRSGVHGDGLHFFELSARFIAVYVFGPSGGCKSEEEGDVGTDGGAITEKATFMGK